MRLGILALLSIATVFGWATSNANLITGNFSGYIDYYNRLGVGYDPSKVGTPISGYFTFDTQDAEYHYSLLIPGRRAEDIGRSIAGCSVVYFGACLSSEGAEPPIILAFHVDTNFGSFDLGAPGSGLGRDYSSVEMNRSFPGYPSSYSIGHDRYIFTRENSGVEYFGNPSGVYERRDFGYSTFLDAGSDGNNFLPSALDWTLPIDLGLADSHYLGLLNNSSTYACESGIGCNRFLGYDPESFSATAKLTALNYSITTSQVPEPATLALLTLGLAGLGLSRRKQ